MGLLDSVLGSAIGAMTGGGQGGNRDMLMKVIGGLLTQRGGGTAGAMGGLGDLLGKLTQSGLGDAVQSWVGSGQNQPVSADQLGNALGGDQVDAMAQQAGMSSGDLLSQLSQMLPQVVDKLTPDGQVPAPGANITDMLGGLLGGLMKR